MSVKTDHLFWLGHDSFRVSGSRTIYFDPWEAGGPPADLILISHDHYDHCDPEAVRRLSGPRTKIFCDAASEIRLKDSGVETPVMVMDPGDELEYLGVVVKAVPAYNVNKDFHPRSNDYLGFIVILDGLSIYHAGDTDFIPEMASLAAQVALLPVSGTYVMTAEEAAAAALAIGPEVVIPMHYGKIVGDESMARDLAEALKGQIEVEIKPQVA